MRIRHARLACAEQGWAQEGNYLLKIRPIQSIFLCAEVIDREDTMPRTVKNDERTEQAPRGNRKQTKVEPLRQRVKNLDKNYNNLAKFPSENPYPVLRIHQDGTILYANKASEPLLKARDSAVGKPAPPEWRRSVKKALSSGQVLRDETTLNERVFEFLVMPITESDYVNFYGTDITEQKTAQEEREITIKLLSLINSKNQMHDLMKLVTSLLRDWSGCEAVGIRLQDGEDFPYFETNGFSDEFVQAESKLCSLNELGEPIRDSRGKVFLECMCGNIISGRFDPSKPFFTEHGSFWTNSTTTLLASTTNADRMAKIRNRCNTAGYESIALVPLRTGREPFGLLQLNSKQRNQFTPKKIALLERLADNLAIGLAQRKTEESLRESEERYRAVIEATDTGFVALDKQGRVLNANLNYAHMVGYSSVDKIIGRQVTEWTAPYDLERNRTEVGKCFEKGSVKNLEIDYKRTDGIIVPIEINANVVQTKNGKMILTICRDITERKRTEETLRESEAKHRRIVDTANEGIWMLDINNMTTFVNKRMTEILGYQGENLVGRPVEDFMFEEDRPDHQRKMENRRRGISENYERRFRRKDGQTVWTLASATPVLDAKHSFKGSFAMFTDITERKLAQDALQNSETRFRELFNNMSSGVAVYEAVDDGADFVFRDFNAASQKMEKTGRQDVIGRRVTEVFPGIREMGLLEVFSRVWKTGRPEHHPTALYKDNRLSSWRENYVYKLPSGEIVAAYDDVTERQAALEQLREERNLLRTLIDHMPDGVYIKDKKGRLLGYNKSLAESWEVRGRNDIIGKTDFDLFEPKLAQHYFDEEQKVIQTGQPIINQESQCTDKSGNPNFLLVTKVPLRDSTGNITGLVGIHRDITERKKAEGTILRLNKILTMIADISKHILQTQDKDLLLKKICNVIVGHAYRMAWMGFCDENSKKIIPQAQAGFEEGYLASIKVTFDDTEYGMGPSGMAVKTAKPDVMRFIATDPRFEPWRTEAVKRGYRSSAAIPIFGENKVVGVLNVYADTEDAFGPEEIQLLEGLASDISTGLRGIEEQTRRHQAEQKLLEYQKHLKRLTAQLTLVEEQERRHIAGNIHDEISQTLAMAKIKLDALRNSPPSEASYAEIEQISSYIEKVIQETRTLTFELSNPILYELGFEAAVAEWLNEQVQVKHGIATEFLDDGKAKPLDDDVKVMLFRNVRELLTNCIKHAKAEKIRVNILRIDDSIQVIVEDNGVGFDTAQLRTTVSKKGKFGLFSIRENMENIGGRFEIESKPGTGCKAIMTVPLKDQSDKKET